MAVLLSLTMRLLVPSHGGLLSHDCIITRQLQGRHVRCILGASWTGMARSPARHRGGKITARINGPKQRFSRFVLQAVSRLGDDLILLSISCCTIIIAHGLLQQPLYPAADSCFPLLHLGSFPRRVRTSLNAGHGANPAVRCSFIPSGENVQSSDGTEI